MSNNVLQKIMEQGQNSLLVSAEKGDIKELQKQLLVGVNPSFAKGLKGFTALHYAASRGHVAIVNELLQAGMKVDVRTNDGETPLHVAVYSGHLLVVEQLLDNNADVNATNHDNETPLFHASSQGRPLIIRILLQRGAIVDILDSITEESAVDRARDQRTRDMFNMLLNNTSNNNKDTHLLLNSITANTASILPFHVLLHIFSYLYIKEVCIAGCVNSKWYRVSMDDMLWINNKQIGIRKWEYVLRNVIGLTTTTTSSFLSFSNKSNKSNNTSNNKLISNDNTATNGASNTSSVLIKIIKKKSNHSIVITDINMSDVFI